MDVERYARVRELFLAVDELPPDQQRAFLDAQCQNDRALITEVLSLLQEHDAQSARREGQSAKPPSFPSVTSPDSGNSDTSSASDPSSTSIASSPGSDAASSDAAPFLPAAQQGSPPDSAANFSPGDQRQRKRRSAKRSDAKRGSNSGARARNSSDVTQQGAQRTHASPRYPDDPRRPRKPPSSGIGQGKAKRDQRFNTAWLWLAAIVPTVLVGSWTYWSVSSRNRKAIAGELASVADVVRVSVHRFLNDQSRLVESWSSVPELRTAIIDLVRQSREDDSVDSIRQSPHAMEVRRQLIALTQRPSIKYVVWDRTGKIIASWLEDGADVGGNVAPDGAANLARAMRGETVLFGPEILRADASGFQPETDLPVMAEIMPIRDDRGRVVATMLVRGFGMYQHFDELFRAASKADGLDVYAVNRSGVMVTNSPVASESLRSGETPVACRLRVSDPGASPMANEIAAAIRRTQPLTYAVAGASSGDSGSKLDAYQNYAGVPVVGAWHWVDAWDLGIIVEQRHDVAFATAGLVRLGFVILGLMLSLTALLVGSRIAKRTAIAQAAVHPLSRYELISELGSGGMGVVYRAKHGQLGRDTALKVLRGDRDNREDRLRFDREAKLAASLSNPHTVTIYDYGRGEEGEAYCVMEFLKGITLYDVVARGGFQPYGRALFILRQVCDSLGEAHSMGLVHRDIKPQNVMLSLDASVGDWAVVFDFGLAKPLQSDANAYQTAETIWAGTPMYMAPERYREPNKIDPRSDIYSVGCIAYFLLSGRPPFIECDPESLFALVLTEQPISIGVHRDEEVPTEIDHLVKRCMAKSVDDRFMTIDELARELDKVISAYPWTVEDARSWWRIHGEEIA